MEMARVLRLLSRDIEILSNTEDRPMNKKLLAALIAGTALTASGYANAFSVNLSDQTTLFGISFDGGGVGSSEFVTFERLTYAGNSIVDVTDVDTDGSIDDGDTFRDYGIMRSDSGVTPTGVSEFGEGVGTSFADVLSGGTYYQYDISATFSDWAGEFTNAEGATDLTYDFHTGSMTWEVTNTAQSLADGEVITTFDVLEATLIEGFGHLDTTSPSDNGSMELLFIISDIYVADTFYIDLNGNGIFEDTPGYSEDVFDYLAYLELLGIDTIEEMLELDGLIFGVASPTTEFSDTGSIADVNTNLGTTFDPADNINSNLIDNDDQFIAVTNSGDFVMRAVPEPGMLGLMGLAFLGLAGFQRRRKHS